MKLLALLYKIAKPILFRCDSERVHLLSLKLLKLVAPLLKTRNFHARADILKKRISGRIGIAAGFDKEAKYFPGFAKLNFDFIELGTFTPAEQPGNPKPRMARHVSQKAILNKMGFNNPGIKDGMQNLLLNLKNVPEYFGIAVSIGKGKSTAPENTVDDYTGMLKYLSLSQAEFCRNRLLYIAINVSSPNTPGLRSLQTVNMVKTLVKSCVRYSPAPILVKFAPDFASPKEFEKNVQAAIKAGAAGVIVTNTTTDYSVLTQLPTTLRDFGGGISGGPLKERALTYLKIARKAAGPKAIVISSGGVMTPGDARERLRNGADLVQVYSGLVYYGPALARDFYTGA